MGSLSHHPALDRRAVWWGMVGVAVTLAIVFVGSDGLVWFDAALVGYLFGVVFRMAGAVDLDGLDWLPKVTLVMAAVAWLAAMWGLVHRGARALVSGRRGPSAVSPSG